MQGRGGNTPHTTCSGKIRTPRTRVGQDGFPLRGSVDGRLYRVPGLSCRGTRTVWEGGDGGFTASARREGLSGGGPPPASKLLAAGFIVGNRRPHCQRLFSLRCDFPPWSARRSNEACWRKFRLTGSEKPATDESRDGHERRNGRSRLPRVRSRTRCNNLAQPPNRHDEDDLFHEDVWLWSISPAIYVARI